MGAINIIELLILAYLIRMSWKICNNTVIRNMIGLLHLAIAVFVSSLAYYLLTVTMNILFPDKITLKLLLPLSVSMLVYFISAFMLKLSREVWMKKQELKNRKKKKRTNENKKKAKKTFSTKRDKAISVFLCALFLLFSLFFIDFMTNLVNLSPAAPDLSKSFFLKHFLPTEEKTIK
ncbi:MAG: hypothetical protein U9O87_01875, partial [Verrucomicrobiota bacterium]|nr:hypothetical protein [Verrucomicrobiota bacterium]